MAERGGRDGQEEVHHGGVAHQGRFVDLASVDLSFFNGLVNHVLNAVQGGLLELLQAPDVAARMGRAGRRRVETVFTTEKMVGRMQALYEQLLGGSG